MLGRLLDLHFGIVHKKNKSKVIEGPYLNYWIY